MIAISPGHWKIGTGASGFVDEVREARLVVERVCELFVLNEVKFKCIMDNQSNNKEQNLTYLVKEHQKYPVAQHVSVHFNAVAGIREEGIGTEVLYASSAMKGLATQMSNAISAAAGFKNRGAKERKDLKLLNHLKENCILIEVCFVNSKEDVQLYERNFEAICHAIFSTLVPHKSNVTESQRFGFGYEAIEEKVQAILQDTEGIQKILSYGIEQKAIQEVWHNRYPSEMSRLDVLGLALLIVRKVK